MNLHSPRLVATAALGLAVAFIPCASADILDVEIIGTVSSNDLTRGPFQKANVGDAVSIRMSFDTDEDQGGGDIHVYLSDDYVIDIGEEVMMASADVAFVFSTFASFHGFENSSTGLLLPGGGTSHNYRVPIFGASGPPTFWLPQGSPPQDHQGAYSAELFDFFNTNTLEDTEGGSVIGSLGIEFDTIIIGNVDDCPPDVDGDGVVDVDDMLAVIASWGCTSCPAADVDGDGLVEVDDLLIVIANFGPC